MFLKENKSDIRPCEMTATKPHTHCQAALAAHIQSLPKSVLRVV